MSMAHAYPCVSPTSTNSISLPLSTATSLLSSNSIAISSISISSYCSSLLYSLFGLAISILIRLSSWLPLLYLIEAKSISSYADVLAIFLTLHEFITVIGYYSSNLPIIGWLFRYFISIVLFVLWLLRFIYLLFSSILALPVWPI